MPVRFRRTFQILPGVRINVSRHGISVSVGPRGAHLTFSKFGVRQSVGLPGSGLSETSYIVGGNRDAEKEHSEGAANEHHRIHHGEGMGCELPGCGCLLLLLVVAAVAAYFGADALKLHPATFLTQLWHSLTQWVR
jgi:hypothetical protein